MSIRATLNHLFQQAMIRAGIPEDFQPHVAPSKKAQFGHYQANGAMAAAKAMKTNPRQLAENILEHLDDSIRFEKTEIAGPGFINIHLSPTWLSQILKEATNEAQTSLSQPVTPETIVVDYSGPNLAKEMHVGHLRSTIIGDALARILSFKGHNVIRQNHVGDWGTQFGMLITELESVLEHSDSTFELKDLEKFYQQAKKRFDDDENFADLARKNVVRLQSGDEKSLELWGLFKRLSLHHSEAIYDQLNVTLTPSDVQGESTYNDALHPLVEELSERGLAKEDAGAKVIFLSELADKDGNPSPVIIQKKDGGYLYATTDIAALRYRAESLKASRIMYFIDARQSLHMQQVFHVARKAGFANDSIKLEHLAFGTMMGKDGKPFKTRTGGTVKLADLLDEAIKRAETVVREKNTALTEDEYARVGQKVGIGAVKYADLSKTRTNDYIFDWDAMLSFEGNTGPYLQYAYARIMSIFRKSGLAIDTVKADIELEHPVEISLAVKALQFNEVLDQVSHDALPHVLCTYLYELASQFMQFYESCPILKTGVEESTQLSRLQISQAVATTLKTGLDLLGIEVMDKM